MFILTKIADLVQISPEDFKKSSAAAIEDNINAKYSNRVVQKVGLCICMYDLLWASEGLIGHGNGFANVNVEFRMIVFRPFKGETILGKISSSSPEGINIRTDFFEEIFVPYKELPESTEFDHNQKLWSWVVDEDKMYYDNQEMVRVTVDDEIWHDQAPDSASDDAMEKAKKMSPYNIRGTMMKEGLGVCLWWE